MMTARIICIGNRFDIQDSAGMAVYDRLASTPLPKGVELVEGGLSGLNLLPLLEQGGRVVFVDSVAGFQGNDGVVVLDQTTVTGCLDHGNYAHDQGLPYLLSVLPEVCDNRLLPEEIVLVGIQGAWDSDLIEQAVELSISIAVRGFKGHTQ